MHIGVAHHLGWAVVVTATADHAVLARRRVELVDDGLPVAPIHHHSGVHPMHDDAGPLHDDDLRDLAERVRRAARSNLERALDSLVGGLSGPIESISVRDWADGFPTDIATLRRAPFESRADSVMYCQVLVDAANARRWRVHRFDHRTVEADAIDLLGDDQVLTAPRATLGPPWNRDHRVAFAATIVAAHRSD